MVMKFGQTGGKDSFQCMASTYTIPASCKIPPIHSQFFLISGYLDLYYFVFFDVSANSPSLLMLYLFQIFFFKIIST